MASRLEKAGGKPAIFTPSSTEAVYQYSSGIPRLVNILATIHCSTGYAVGKREIDAAIIREVAEDLNGNSSDFVHTRGGCFTHRQWHGDRSQRRNQSKGMALKRLLLKPSFSRSRTILNRQKHPREFVVPKVFQTVADG